MNISKAVLLPVDFQKAFDHAPWPRRWNRDVDGNGRALLAAWRRAGRPLIHVRHDSTEPGSTLRAGQPGHDFREGFEPAPGEQVLAKAVNSAFIGTDLDKRLRALDARMVIAFGISTDMCVSTTIRTGANLGWPMVLVPDACDCFDLPDLSGATIPAETVHSVHVATLAFEFCKIVSTRQLLDLLADETANAVSTN